MPEAYVVDTHALFWHLTADGRLGEKAREVIGRSATPDVQVVVSAVSVAELYYVNQKAGRPLDFESEVRRLASAGLEFADF